MPIKILSAALSGLDAVIINVEADAGGGDFGNITIVGLPDTAVSEAKERVKSALRNCGSPYPRRKITVNLAPADLRKRGPAYDLPIAVSILALNNNFRVDFSKMLLAGELSLGGEVRPINGVLAMAIAAQAAGLESFFVPYDNALEAGLILGLKIFPVSSLKQLISHLKHRELMPEFTMPEIEPKIAPEYPDFKDIKGQEKAKRALEIAAAGGHNLIFCGPPGSGKTLLAKGAPGILPGLEFSEKLELTKIYSAIGALNRAGLISARPFRSPHHSASVNSLIGGGSWPKPGEISLAHRGVLFLDEFPEFSRAALENLRQPLEDGFIQISRAAAHLRLPARFMLLAAMNPCPCGHAGSKEETCRCTESQAAAYQRRLSGPIMDRIDLHVEVGRVPWKKLAQDNEGESSAAIKARVEAARQK